MQINPVTRYIRFITLFILAISVFLFIHYLNMNKGSVLYDEARYVDLSKFILSKGLFSINDQLNTYFYPLLISLTSLFTNGNPVVIKSIFCIMQFLLYLYTIWFLSVRVISNDNKIGRIIILLLGWINPYLINATTLFLTDISASCLLVLSLLLLLSGSLNNRIMVIGIVLGYCSVMIRPSSLMIVLLIMLLMLARYYFFRDFKLKYYLLFSIISTIVFVPQLYNNVISFNHWTPLLHLDLYKHQSLWSAHYLKYGTVTISGEDPSLFYYSPWIVEPQINIFNLLLTHPILSIKLFVIHMFAIIDWGYVNTFISDFYSPSRLPASLFLYTNWYLIFIGIIYFIKNLRSNKKDKRFIFIYVSLAIIGLSNMLFIGTTLIESRFGFSVLMILLPFVTIPKFKSVDSNKTLLLSGAIVFYLVFVISMFYFSFLLDLQTHRINWFNRF